MKNLPEFKALINRYETITIDEIKAVFELDIYGKVLPGVLEELTGFGHPQTCTLCQKTQFHCGDCVYACSDHDMGCIEDDTYGELYWSKTPESLLLAYRNRAEYMRSYLKKLNIKY